MASGRAQQLRIALFGGTFDPPHIGHLAFCRELAGSGGFEEVWVLPAFIHPFSKRMAPFEDRLAMCRITFAPLGPRVKVREDEAEVGGSGFTIDLISHLRKRYPAKRFTLALGADNYQQRHRWREFEEVERMVEVQFFGRKGWERENDELDLPAPFPEASSSEIRRLAAAGRMPSDLLPPGIAAYIRERGLYRRQQDE